MNTRIASLPILALALGFVVTAQTSIQTFTYTYTGNPLLIARDDANIITVSAMPVPRSIKIQSVKVTVDIEYPKPGDLNLFFYSAEATRTKLLERNCGDKGTLHNITFDDSASNRYSDACPTTSGSYRGNEPLGNYNGQNAAGLWTIAIENNGSNDTVGWLLGYSITITGEAYSQPMTSSELVVNSASLAGGGAAPGELLSIFGTNLGSDKPVAAPTGDLPTSLGGTEVYFNEVKAPIKYVSKYRVDVQAPYAVGVPGELWLSVKNSLGTSDPVKLQTVSTKPAVVTINSYGRGQIDALNEDNSLNRNQAANRGSVITVYATGLGITLPIVPAGQDPGAKPTPVVWNTVYASIAGTPATVVDATLAPGRPGVYAVRIQIPLDIPIGPVELKISSVSSSSQNGAFIRVK